MKRWRQPAAETQQETGEGQERLAWVSLTTEKVYFGLSGFGCLCPSGVEEEGRGETERGTLGTAGRWGPWRRETERRRQRGLRGEAAMKEDVNAVKEKWGAVTSFPVCIEVGDSSLVWLLLAS